MSIELSPPIQSIYPVVVRANPENFSRGQDFPGTDELGTANSTRRVEKISPAPEQGLRQQKLPTQLLSADDEDNARVPATTSAQVLSQMFHKMGGTGVSSSPGQIFNALV